MTNDHLLMNIILPRCHRAPLAADLPNREAATDEVSWAKQQSEGGDHDDDEEEEDLDVDDINGSTLEGSRGNNISSLTLIKCFQKALLSCVHTRKWSH